MRMSETEFEGVQPPIDSYAPGGFRVAGRFVDGPILLSAGGLAKWEASDAPPFGEPAIQALLALAGRVDVLMLGMGESFRLPPAATLERLHLAGLGVEPMATPSACRSYNVALAERRRVAAALLPV